MPLLSVVLSSIHFRSKLRLLRSFNSLSLSLSLHETPLDSHTSKTHGFCNDNIDNNNNKNTCSCILTHDDKNKNKHGSGFTKQERSEPDDPHDHFLLLQPSKSSRSDYFDQPPNKSMSLRSDSLLSLSAADDDTNNNMLSFSSSVKDGNQPSLFSFYQPSSPAYIRNTGIYLYIFVCFLLFS
ncbi:hypothetical protein HanLR1_Chr11g0385451 [Helianthus annuus]|nr:hypothetical protein HanLR1_Chr11g0385451 [Helianthus annuus]